MSKLNLKYKSIYVASCNLNYGLFAGRNFRQGEQLFRFTGPVINLADAIAKGDTEGNALQISSTTYIDLEPPGVFANHACDPNAGIRNSVEAHALRDILQGEEVRFDYSTTMSERRWTMTCRCGTSECRGTVGDFHELPYSIQKRYLGLGIVQPFIVQEIESTRDLDSFFQPC